MTIQQTITVDNDNRDTVVKALRQHLPGNPSWSTAKRMLHARRIAIGGVMCIDEARKLGRGEVITVHEQPFPVPPKDKDVKIHHVDADVIIVEKPAGMITLRRNSDLNWSWEKKNRQPTLDECVPRLIGEHAAAKRKTSKNNLHLPRMFPVHRIDRDSSGLLVFARNKEAQTTIIHQFAQHAAVRKYLTLIPGKHYRRFSPSTNSRTAKSNVPWKQVAPTKSASIWQNSVIQSAVTSSIADLLVFLRSKTKADSHAWRSTRQTCRSNTRRLNNQ